METYGRRVVVDPPLAVVASLTTTIAVYELADGETAIVSSGPFTGQAADPAGRSAAPALARLADREIARVDGVLDAIERIAPHSHERAA